MASSHMLEAPRQRHRRGKQHPRPYQVSEFVRAYLAALGATLLPAAVYPVLLIPAGLIAGAVLTRCVTARVVSWQLANNLDEVYRAKVKMMVTRPLSVPVLIFKVVITRVL
ncbi:hypothetical protein QO034_19575 [Sedimentitalea sp. JM2-8]|uniref:Uncharacterized protein n=1 Tax=Sedimentitalea xiamensis TaxID=3050037 RepID=A0ABT7FJG5_9RHOB|nr:hypothetical protein [Sedimentitalea xiamensis]MDK3075286.1 hypothetical protein [Sedimentitalea xiamensis]